jgi:hypothetical protein
MRLTMSLLLFCCIACTQCGAAAAADTGGTDLTITVVTDPDQLSEKVNTIKLPGGADDAAESSSGEDKKSERAKQKDNTADEVDNDAEGLRRDKDDDAGGGERAKGPTEDSKQDAKGEQQDRTSSDGATSG